MSSQAHNNNLEKKKKKKKANDSPNPERKTPAAADFLQKLPNRIKRLNIAVCAYTTPKVMKFGYYPEGRYKQGLYSAMLLPSMSKFFQTQILKWLLLYGNP